MPYLAVPRRGWENEHLATFLLAKIAFVAHPLTVADDVGSDFFCTLFESSNENGMEVLFPRNSFAIQVKSRRENFAATNKIDYLLRLELPFFLGVVDRHTLRLDVYAAEHLPMMFSHLGRPRELTLCPLEPNAAGGTPPYHGSPDVHVLSTFDTLWNLLQPTTGTHSAARAPPSARCVRGFTGTLPHAPARSTSSRWIKLARSASWPDQAQRKHSVTTSA
jgi:hypothetical protein